MLNTRSSARAAAKAGSSHAGSSKRTSSELEPPEPSHLAKRVSKSPDTMTPEQELFMREFEAYQVRKARREARAMEKLKAKQLAKAKQGYTSESEEKDEEKDSYEEDDIDAQMYKSDAVSVESWDLQDSDDESQEVVQDSVQEAVVELNEYCLLRVFSFLSGKERLAVQRVSRQWKQVSEQFVVLNSQDFCLPAPNTWIERDATNTEDHKEIKWDAFMRTLTRAGNSVRELDLSAAFSEYHFRQLQAAIDNGACGMVERVVVRSRWPTWVSSSNFDGQQDLYQYGLNVTLEGVEPLAEVCARLPNLRCLVIQECLDVNAATLDRLKEQVLPRIQKLEITWGSGRDCFCRAGQQMWARFFERIPSELRRLSMNGLSRNCCFLRLLVERLEKGLKELRALHLDVNTTYEFLGKSEPELGASLLQRVLNLLGNQLTEFSICANGQRMPGAMAHWSEMTALRKLQLYMNHLETAYRDLPNLGQMRNLREFHIVTHNAVSLQGMPPEDELYAPLSQLPGLETLVVPLDTNRPKILDHISLPNLRTLRLVSTSYCILRAHIIPSLAGLVSRCPRLDLLSMILLWDIKKLEDWWLTIQLLCQMEIALLHSRAAPTDSQSLPEGKGGPEGSSKAGTSPRQPKAVPTSFPGDSTNPEQGSKEEMESAVREMLRERVKYRGGGPMVRPLLVKLGRSKMMNKRSEDQELKAKCILEEKYIHSIFTEKSSVLRVAILPIT